MRRRYVTDDADLPDHDLIIELPGTLGGLVCHLRHYVRSDAHVVIAGELTDGASPIVFAEAIAKEVATRLIPPEREFTLVAYTPQHPLSSRFHFLSALDACSMVVVPYDGHGLVHGVESTAALWYALEHPRVPCLLAYDHVDAAQLADFEHCGLEIAKVDRSLPGDVSAAVDAVDRACAAYECLQSPVGPRSPAAT